jgi:hypothetical protein
LEETGKTASRDERRGWREASALAREIDGPVYALYGLTVEEIRIVEGKT